MSIKAGKIGDLCVIVIPHLHFFTSHVLIWMSPNRICEWAGFSAVPVGFGVSYFCLNTICPNNLSFSYTSTEMTEIIQHNRLWLTINDQ